MGDLMSFEFSSGLGDRVSTRSSFVILATVLLVGPCSMAPDTGVDVPSFFLKLATGESALEVAVDSGRLPLLTAF